jgi:hypothetical protein
MPPGADAPWLGPLVPKFPVRYFLWTETHGRSTWGSPLRRTVTLDAQFHHAMNNSPTHRPDVPFSAMCCVNATKSGTRPGLEGIHRSAVAKKK